MKRGKTLFLHHDRDGLTLQEIAGIMDLTRERVRQIEERALMKLMVNLAAKNVNQADLFGGML